MEATSALIGSRIKEARNKKGLSQTELANLIQKTLRTVQKYESGEIEPPLHMVHTLARILEVESIWLMGYEVPHTRMQSVSDVLAIIHQLAQKDGIRFEIDVQRPPKADGWSCSLRFDGMNRNSPYNQDVCQFLEDYKDLRESIETYWASPEKMQDFMDKSLTYYAQLPLMDKTVAYLSTEERIRRRDMLIEQQIAEKRKSTNQSEAEGSESST